MRRRTPILFALATLACCWSLAGPAAAHTGGPLDDEGCHSDRRRGNFHCHRGPARGYEFRSRADMREAVDSGNLAERPADTEGFLRKLWPFGRHDETSPEPPSPQAPVDLGAEVTLPTPAAATSANKSDAAIPDVEKQAAAPAGAPVPPGAVPKTGTVQPPSSAVPLPSSPPARAPAAPLPAPTAEPTPIERSVRSYEERLRTLDGLRDRGVITTEEYEARRKAILDEL